MKEMIKFDLPKNQSSIIKVIGVGGGGSNAVTHMYNLGITGVDFIICNTDTQAMEASEVPNKLQLGRKGLGAGSIPAVGREAALEQTEEIKEILEKNTQMLFITAGMGGGTGTGAAPVIASIAKELGILTVGIVTLPFSFEGRKRRLQAEEGVEELKNQVDTLLLIVNDKLRALHGDLKLSEAFQQADDILTTAARSIAEIITVTGYINVDFEDVKTVMKESGKAIMGSGAAEGEDRAQHAVDMALSSPLLNDSNISGASNILLYITSGTDEISMDEVIKITDHIQREAGANADIIWGNGISENLDNKISVTLVATGFSSEEEEKGKNKTVYDLNEGIKPEVRTVSNQYKKPENKEVIHKVKPSETKSNEPVLFDEKEEKNTLVFDFTRSEKKTTEQPTSKVQEPDILNKKKEKEETSSNEQPYIKPIEPAGNNEQDEMERKAQERIRTLKDLSIKLRSPGGLSELENEPAYVRKNVKFNETPASSDSNVSKFSLSEGEDKEVKIKSNNKYLHDKAD